MVLLLILEEFVNEKMCEYNLMLCGELQKPSHLHFRSFKSYDFETLDGEGTDTNYKGMFCGTLLF